MHALGSDSHIELPEHATCQTQLPKHHAIKCLIVIHYRSSSACFHLLSNCSTYLSSQSTTVP